MVVRLFALKERNDRLGEALPHGHTTRTSGWMDGRGSDSPLTLWMMRRAGAPAADEFTIGRDTNEEEK